MFCYIFHAFVRLHNAMFWSVLRKMTRLLLLQKKLFVDGKPCVVVIYHIFHGTYLGSRITRCCRKCKIYEHYGFWIENGERYFEDDFEDMEFLILSEETVFDMTLMRENASLLVMGALPFRTFAASYNRRFKYGSSLGNVNGEKSKVKRMKRFEAFLLIYFVTFDNFK